MKVLIYFNTGEIKPLDNVVEILQIEQEFRFIFANHHYHSHKLIEMFKFEVISK